MAIGGLTVTAQEADVAQIDATEVMVAVDDFTEIETSEVPAAVTEALSTNYPTATINKVYVNKANYDHHRRLHHINLAALSFCSTSSWWPSTDTQRSSNLR